LGGFERYRDFSPTTLTKEDKDVIRSVVEQRCLVPGTSNGHVARVGKGSADGIEQLRAGQGRDKSKYLAESFQRVDIGATCNQNSFLPQVWLTSADTSVVPSMMSKDFPVWPLWSLQSGTMYQPLSLKLSF
jgi:hypothetical protein